MKSQGSFGAKYKINGHRTGGVQSRGKEYRILFERCFSENSLEEIEQIDWAHVTVEQLAENYPACSLPEGYGFTVKNIAYIRDYDSFEVTLEAGKQYWGDVTPYQAQIESLSAAVTAQSAQLASKDAAITDLSAQLAEADELAVSLYEELAGASAETTETAEATETAAEDAEEVTA